MATVSLTLRFKLPWWWRLYVWSLMFFEATIGGVDSEVAAKFLVRHGKCEVSDG